MLNHVKLQSFKTGIEMARETVEMLFFNLGKSLILRTWK